MMHRLSLMNISLFTTMIAFNLTPSSLLSKTASLCVILPYPTKGGFISVFSFWNSSFVGGFYFTLWLTQNGPGQNGFKGGIFL